MSGRAVSEEIVHSVEFDRERCVACVACCKACPTQAIRVRSQRVVVSDRGPGIPDIELAMQEGWSTATAEMRARGFGAGMGLPNIKRSTDSFEIESTPGTGTTLRYSVRLTAATAN